MPTLRNFLWLATPLLLLAFACNSDETSDDDDDSGANVQQTVDNFDAACNQLMSCFSQDWCSLRISETDLRAQGADCQKALDDWAGCIASSSCDQLQNQMNSTYPVTCPIETYKAYTTCPPEWMGAFDVPAQVVEQGFDRGCQKIVECFGGECEIDPTAQQNIDQRQDCRVGFTAFMACVDASTCESISQLDYCGLTEFASTTEAMRSCGIIQ